MLELCTKLVFHTTLLFRTILAYKNMFYEDKLLIQCRSSYKETKLPLIGIEYNLTQMGVMIEERDVPYIVSFFNGNILYFQNIKMSLRK